MKRFLGIGLAAFIVVTAHAGQISVVAAKVCDVRDYGAKGDGLTLDTVSIQNAIEACAANPSGGTVLLGQGGIFLSGPIEMRSHVRLDVEGRSTLLSKHARMSSGGGNTTPDMVIAKNVEDVAITGSGTIDGNEHSAPGEVEEPPHAVEFIGVTRGRIEGVNIRNSEVIGILWSHNVQVRNVRIVSDLAKHWMGASVLNSKGVTLDHVSTEVGGLGLGVSAAQGSLDSTPVSADIRITDCTFQGGKGISIQAGRGVHAERLRFAGTTNGISVDSQSAGVADVSFRDVEMFGVDTPLDLKAASAGSITQLAISNFKAVRAKSAGTIAGSANAPIAGLTLQNIDIEAENGLMVENVQGHFDGVSVKAKQGQGVLLAASANVERK